MKRLVFIILMLFSSQGIAQKWGVGYVEISKENASSLNTFQYGVEYESKNEFPKCENCLLKIRFKGKEAKFQRIIACDENVLKKIPKSTVIRVGDKFYLKLKYQRNKYKEGGLTIKGADSSIAL